MKKNFIVICLLFTSNLIFAQHQEIGDKPSTWKGKPKHAADTTNLLYAFKNGHTQGHFRYFLMATDNKIGLSDYYANAIGGGLKYETAPFKHFQFGVSGFYVFNIGSSNFIIPDAATNQNNRYEIDLFDITAPNNKNNIDRLEELYLKYHRKNTTITLGKQLINTPFINLQDGRMRPTEVGGVYATTQTAQNLQLEGGFIYQISPRSTTEWYKAAESIGIYSQGVNTDGTKSNYKNNLESKGIAMLGGNYKITNQIAFIFFNMYVDNIFNSALLQTEFQHKLKNSNTLKLALQTIRQDAINNGGNTDQTKTYFVKKSSSQTFGIKVAWQNKIWQTSLNYNRITAQGRYLMPREWGRDAFFTFLPRERNDGLGDVNAYAIKAQRNFMNVNSKIQLAIGFYNLPDVGNFRLNKYEMPSYAQFNIDFRHEFKGMLKGFDLQTLLTHKAKMGHSATTDKNTINKVELTNYNLILNYHF